MPHSIYYLVVVTLLHNVPNIPPYGELYELSAFTGALPSLSASVIPNTTNPLYNLLLTPISCDFPVFIILMENLVVLHMFWSHSISAGNVRFHVITHYV